MMGRPHSETGLIALDALKALAQATPPTAVVAAVLDAVQSHRTRKQALLLAAIVERHDRAIEDLLAALSDERLLELVGSALRAAEEAHSDEKVLLLADITGEAIWSQTSAAKVDTGQYLIDVIADLQAIEIAVLRVLASPRIGHGNLSGQTIVGGLTELDLANLLPHLGDALVVALARLSAAGLIDPGEATYGGGQSFGPTAAGSWVVSALDRVRQA
jgi:hypothetical protein